MPVKLSRSQTMFGNAYFDALHRENRGQTTFNVFPLFLVPKRREGMPTLMRGKKNR